MMNNSLVIQGSAALSRRIEKEAGPGLNSRVRRAYELVYGRNPRPEELRVIHTSLEGKENNSSAWRVFCHALLGTSEFLYNN
jgi:hypothetical protein